MVNTDLVRLTSPGAFGDRFTLLVALAGTALVLAADIMARSVPLNLFYVFPLAFAAMQARSFYVAVVVAAASFLAQLYVLSSYDVSRTVFMADAAMIAVACGITVWATRAFRRSHFRAEIAAGNAKLAAALESMTDAVLITDTKGELIDCNPAFATYYRFPNRQACATHFSDYPKIIDVAELSGEPLPPENWAVPRALRGEAGSNAECMLRLKSTGETWIGSYSFAPIRDETGAIIGSVVTGRDVTKQRAAERQALQSHELLTMAEASAAAGSWTWNMANDSFNWSPGLYRIFGLNAEVDSASLAAWGKALHPEDRPGAERCLNEAIAHHTPFETTYRVRWPDGEVRWIDAVGTASYDDQGRPTRMSGICIDVTNRRAAEERLSDAQSDFRAFFENASVGAVQIDSRGHYINVNPRFCEMTGYTREELVGRMGPLDLSNPQDGETVKKGLSGVFEGKEEYYRVILPLVRRDGSTRWVEVAASPIRDNTGQIHKMAAIVADITERRQAELRLRESESSLSAFFENAAVGAVQLNATGQYVRVNPAYCAIVGYTSEELLGKMTPLDLDMPGARDSDRSGLDRMLAGLDPRYNVEKEIVRKDGTHRWVSVAASVAERLDGQPQKTTALVTDITARKEAEASLLESRDQLKALNQSLEAQVQSRTASLVEANRQLERLARLDALTGIPNRLAANERLRQEYVFMKRMKQPYSILMMDIDHFKAVNDTCGHEAGDHVLREIAQCLRRELRESDFVARFGGEEFIAVLPATRMEGGLVVASKLRQAVEDLEIQGVGRVTISIGVAVAAPENGSQDEAVNEADEGLYAAKAAGRNRIVGSADPVAGSGPAAPAIPASPV